MRRRALAVAVVALASLGIPSVATPAGRAPQVAAADGCAATGPLDRERPWPAAPAPVAVHAEEVLRASVPTAVAARRGDARLFVAERAGRIRVLGAFAGGETVLDLRHDVTTLGESGLLGLTFAPDGRFLYVHRTDARGTLLIEEYTMIEGLPDDRTRRRLVVLPQTSYNHKGGALAFGPDGYLYATIGDGSGAGDPENRAQDLSSLFGKVIRIDPRRTDDGPYRVPEDNPFVGRAGARPEIWAYGFRNPWRLSIDRATGDLWIGDVGETCVEEVDRVPTGFGGANYGWNRYEGTRDFREGPPVLSVPPAFEYTHDGGACAVAGGHVYRGRALRELQGWYVFADVCAARLWALSPRSPLGERTAADLGALPGRPVSFGETLDGELLVLTLEGSILRLRPDREGTDP